MEVLEFLKNELDVESTVKYLKLKLGEYVEIDSVISLWKGGSLPLYFRSDRSIEIFEWLDGTKFFTSDTFTPLEISRRCVDTLYLLETNIGEVSDFMIMLYPSTPGFRVCDPLSESYYLLDYELVDPHIGHHAKLSHPMEVMSKSTMNKQNLFFLRSDLDNLACEFKNLSASNTLPTSKRGREKVVFSTTERKSMLKIILGMAIEKYGYDPDNRNKATGENAGSIFADLEKHGLSVNVDTIRKHLKAAAEDFK